MGKFSSTNQPKGRGKSKQTLIVEAIQERALLGLSEKSTKEEAEKAIFGYLAEAAFNPTPDTATIANTCLSVLMKKGWPDVKPVMPTVEFELTGTNATERANEILDAIATGVIPADIAKIMVDVIRSSVEIEKITELLDRIEAIENALNAKSEQTG